MAPKQVPLTPDLERRVASEAHWFALAALNRESGLGLDSLVFQGGTSLALAYASPRFSEDLDFLLAREKADDLGRTVDRVGRHVEDNLQIQWPGVKVSVKSRVRDDNPNALFHLSVALPGVLGHVLVKLEFWRIPQVQLAPYLKAHTPLHHPPRVATIAGVARPEQLLVDKITALAHRDRLKWRDLFDLWFLLAKNGEPRRLLASAAQLGERLGQSGALYGKTGADTAEGLQRFLAIPEEDIIRRAEQGLKPWLTPELWAQLWPDTVAVMAQTARQAARAGLDGLTAPVSEEGPEEPVRPRNRP